MKPLIIFFVSFMATVAGVAQNFELVDKQENYQVSFSQLVKIPLKIKNNTDKAQFYVFRKVRSDLGESQKAYFCLDNNCLDPAIVEFSKKVEPGESLNLNYTVESGLQPILNSFKFEIFPKGNPTETIEHSVSLTVEERGQRSVYQSHEITINDVYPNPVQDLAVIDYKIYSDAVKAKIVVHNILGRPMGDFDLPSTDSRLKIQTDDFAPGVYFYTLYINNSAVLTRKIMVRK